MPFILFTQAQSGQMLSPRVRTFCNAFSSSSALEVSDSTGATRINQQHKKKKKGKKKKRGMNLWSMCEIVEQVMGFDGNLTGKACYMLQNRKNSSKV